MAEPEEEPSAEATTKEDDADKDEKKDEGDDDKKEAEKVDEGEKKDEKDDDDKEDDDAKKEPAKDEEEKPDEEMPDADAAEEPAAEAKDDKKKKDDEEEATSPSPGRRKRKQKSATPPSSDRPSRTKRERKSAESYHPENFRDVDRSVPLVRGRGAKLADLKEIKETVAKSSTDELIVVHKLLYTMRGAPPRKDVRNNILAFHGFLTQKEKDEDPKEREAIDDDAETKMGQKAYKLNIPALKKMCDFFSLDRKGLTDKDSLVNCLLDFLGAPKKELLKGHKKEEAAAPAKKKKKRGKKKKKKSADDEEEEGDDDEEEEEEEEEEKEEEDDDYEVVESGVMPTDKQLRQWVRAYVRCFNTDKVTLKHAVVVAGEKFGVDMAPKKDTLKKILHEEL